MIYNELSYKASGKRIHISLSEHTDFDNDFNEVITHYSVQITKDARVTTDKVFANLSDAVIYFDDMFNLFCQHNCGSK